MRVEDVFGIVKNIFGFVKVRYKGLARNTKYFYVPCEPLYSDKEVTRTPLRGVEPSKTDQKTR